MVNPAAVADIEARWRPLSAQEATNATALLADAWALLQAHRPNLEDDIYAGTVSIANVVRVVVSAVLRVLRNPDGKVQESIDDYSYRRDSAVAGGALYFDPADLASLIPSTQVRRNSVRLTVYGDE